MSRIMFTFLKLSSLSQSGLLLRLLAAVCLVGAVTSCAPAPSRTPDVFYDLSVQPVGQTYGSTASLSIASISAQGVMSGRPFVTQTSTDPVAYTELRGHLWHIPPSQLLQSALVDGLSAGSADLQIGTSDTLTSPDYRLKLKLRQFSFTPNGEAVIALDAVIKSRQAEILKTATYSARQPVAGDTAEAAVRAYQDAVQQIAEQLSADIAELF